MKIMPGVYVLKSQFRIEIQIWRLWMGVFPKKAPNGKRYASWIRWMEEM